MNIKGGRMMQVNARDFGDALDVYVDLAQGEPVVVRKAGRPVAVLISFQEYQHVERTRDGYWAGRARVQQA
jgi:prevent-host-death family protein